MKIPDQPIQMQFRSVRRRFRGRFRRAVGPIEVTALLNVVVLVGLFHFASSRFVLQPGVRVRLPEAPFTDGAPYGARVLTLAQSGLMFFNDERMTLATLEPALARAGRAAADAPLLIEADEGTPYGTLMAVYALAAEAGLRDVVLATRPPPVAP
ncbi:MAG: ExbD/TolR family protein [Kiritimatiellia bacterium]